MVNRRSFLARLGLAISSTLWNPVRWKTLPPLALELFFDNTALIALRQRFNDDPMFASFKNELASFDRPTEWRFVQSEVRYNDHLYHVARLAKTAQQMAFYYAMSANEDAGMLSAECIRQLMRFPKWDYFLEDGEQVVGIQRASAATVAVSLAADWLGDLIPTPERDTWLETMGSKGCEPCFLSIYGMRYPDRVKGWSVDPTSTYFEHRPGDRIDLSNWPIILDRTNLKAVPASALAIGAVAYESRHSSSEDSQRWLEQAVFSLASFRELYARDGSYDENVSYADYTSMHLAQAMQLLAEKKGIDLYDHINWVGLMDFVTGMTMPTAADKTAVVNFGDTGRSFFSAVPFWVASRFYEGQAQWFGLNRSIGHNEWSLIWYAPDRSASPPPNTPQIYHSDLDWIVARTGFEADDLVVAMRSGGPANHEHADRNSIIVKCFGEQLVADPYRPPYSFSDPSWMLRTTAGHSALLIDGKGHQYHDGSEGTNPSDAYARIIRKVERSGYLLWASDATPAYQLVHPDVQSVTRTVLVLYEVPSIVVIDKVINKEVLSIVESRFFAFNSDEKAILDTSGTEQFRITRPGAFLDGIALGKASQRITTGQLPIPEEVAQRHPFLSVETVHADQAPILITVLNPVRTGQQETAVEWDVEDDAYRIALVGNDRVNIDIFDRGPLPEIAIRA